ncbi:MAG: hypothetical protein JW762_09860 [Dehalococcoidales bacterium]|nr:hypothetical protein [Dehalococcoidales bacterium]
MPYIASLEKQGIPTVFINFGEETGKVEHDSTLHGVPKIRHIVASRNSVGGVSEAEILIQPVLDALTRPLTAEEQESGLWAPHEPRILFEGTLPEAEEFYNQTENIPGMLNAPFAKYTDGLPVVIPTEERVETMLKGTSHKPDELIVLQRDMEVPGYRVLEAPMIRKKGDVIRFMPMFRTATVEQVAVNAVMAGCKPEQFPVVLAIAESGGGTGDGRGGGGAFIISGPIYKEIGMNVTNSIFGPGNPAAKAIGRVGSLLWRNLGGYKETVTTITTLGNPIVNGGFIIAEYADGLPEGWKGLNEELGYRKDESILMPHPGGLIGDWGIGQQNAPGVYRSLQRTGHGAIARFLDVKGIPGPHNYLEYLTKGAWATRDGGFTMVMPPQVAQDLCDYGFKTKQEVYEWIWKRSFEPVSEFRMRGMQDYITNGWLGIESTSGKPWKELPDDYMVPAGGDDPFGSYNILLCNMEETAVARFGGGHGPAFSIDEWR